MKVIIIISCLRPEKSVTDDRDRKVMCGSAWLLHGRAGAASRLTHMGISIPLGTKGSPC